jgi:PQQ system protein
MKSVARCALALAAPAVLGSCDYVRLLRPSVLKQLNPPVVRLVNELPRVDDVNEGLIGGLFARGGLGHAKVGGDGVMRATVRIPAGEYLWRPAIIVMPKGGELELDIYNEDPYSYHAAVLPSLGERHALMLPVNSHGKARIRLDQPGYYWFGCPVANHVTRGMLGFIFVYGDTPAEAKLDRPPQPRPRN